MEQITINLYQYDELSEDAKKKAREWFTGPGFEFAWCDESRDSLNKFCEYFGVRLCDWDIGPCRTLFYETDRDKTHFRNVKLKVCEGERVSNGYYLSELIWDKFCDTFKITGNAMRAFDEALKFGFKNWRDDMEYQLSDDEVAETIEANEYTFLVDGTRFDAPS